MAPRPFNYSPTGLLAYSPRQGFTLLEIVPVLTIVAMLATIVILALNPQKQYEKIRNEQRRGDVAFLADAISSYSRERNRELLLRIPRSPASPIEICGDSTTGSCTSLLDLRALIPVYLDTTPLDPLASDPDTFNEHSRYFVSRSKSDRITVFAYDTEPAGSEDIAVTR